MVVVGGQHSLLGFPCVRLAIENNGVSTVSKKSTSCPQMLERLFPEGGEGRLGQVMG